MTKWFKNLKTIYKISVLAFVIILMNILVFSLTLNRVYDSNINKSKQYAIEYSRLQSKEISKEIEKTSIIVSDIVTSITSLKGSGDLSRERVIKLLEDSLKKNPNIIAHGTGWEPNAFDKNDSKYVNTQNHDSTGRFIPYVYMEGDKVAVEALVDYEVEGTGDWYLIPKEIKEPILTEPYIYPINGVDVLMTTISVPVLDEKNNFLGVVTADIGLEHLQQKVEELTPLGGYSILISTEGTIVAHGEQSDKILKSSLNEGLLSEEALSNIKAGVNGQFFSQESNEDVFNTYEPIKIDGIKDSWTFFTAIPKDNILKDYYKILSVIIITSVISLCIMIYTITVIAKNLSSPIKDTVKLIKKAENGDLTAVAKIDRKDEFGILSSSFNRMMINIRSLVEGVTSVAKNIKDSSDDLDQISNDTTKAVEEVSKAIEEIAIGASEQAKEAQTVTERASNLSLSIDEVSSYSKIMKVKSDEAVGLSNKGLKTMGTLEETTEATNQLTKKVNYVIEKLDEKSNLIGKIVSVITDISDQTGLLSLNAAIEAARAGESGKGFAVVADEIRNLSEQSKDSTAEIEAVIRDIQNEIAEVVHTVNESSITMEKNNKAVENAKSVFESIVKAINTISTEIDKVNISVETMGQEKNSIMIAIESISAVSEEQAASSQEVSASMEESAASMNRVLESTEKLNELVKTLNESVNQFKL